MIKLQYNRNTYNPNRPADWRDHSQHETLEGCRAILAATRKAYKRLFGVPSDIKYRIVKG